MRIQLDSSEIFFKGKRLYKSKQDVSKIKRWINESPSETLNVKTPIEAIKELRSNINVTLAR
jgi:IS30 family transposase